MCHCNMYFHGFWHGEVHAMYRSGQVQDVATLNSTSAKVPCLEMWNIQILVTPDFSHFLHHMQLLWAWYYITLISLCLDRQEKHLQISSSMFTKISRMLGNFGISGFWLNGSWQLGFCRWWLEWKRHSWLQLLNSGNPTDPRQLALDWWRGLTWYLKQIMNFASIILRFCYGSGFRVVRLNMFRHLSLVTKVKLVCLVYYFAQDFLYPRALFLLRDLSTLTWCFTYIHKCSLKIFFAFGEDV